MKKELSRLEAARSRYESAKDAMEAKITSKIDFERPVVNISDKFHIMAVDGIRKNNVDLGGFILQNGTETWVASLIDAGVAVEMEVGK